MSRQQYDLSKLTIDERYSDLGKRKIVDGVGYSDEVWGINKEVIRQEIARNAVYGVPLEYDEQASLFAKADKFVAEYPMLALMFAIPNGQYRAGQRMEPGLKEGVPDIFLPYPVFDEKRIWYGLFLELKRADHSYDPSPAQLAWMKQLQINGFKCVVAYGAKEAWGMIMDYLGLETE